MKLSSGTTIVLLFLALSNGNAQERQPFIINGQPTDAFPAVGIVGESSVGGFCTGTLISPTHVLTAAHCAEALLDIGTPDSGTFEVAGRIYRTVSVEIIPTYDNRLFLDDVAILVLADPVLEVDPVPISDIPPQVGELVTIVGYGGQGTPELGSDGTFGNKAVGSVVVDRVTANEFSWSFNERTESNPAPGDSGGPVFIDTEDGLLLAGIVSSGTTVDAELGDTSFNMRVDAYESWITETVLRTTEIDVVTDPAVEQPGPSDDGLDDVADTGTNGNENNDGDQAEPSDDNVTGVVDVPPDTVVDGDEVSGPTSPPIVTSPAAENNNGCPSAAVSTTTPDQNEQVAQEESASRREQNRRDKPRGNVRRNGNRKHAAHWHYRTKRWSPSGKTGASKSPVNVRR